ITGNSTGFNSILTEQLLAKGEDVDTTVRKPEQLKGLIDPYPKAAIAFPVDITNPQLLKEAIDRALDSFGGLDLLANSPGYGLIRATSGGQCDKDSVRMIDFQVF
uniref:SDR family NAD(P)-dependent oxidoreductase n=1 Tax=Anaplasma marginale TaxID=770 RepID=UPI0005B3E26B